MPGADVGLEETARWHGGDCPPVRVRSPTGTRGRQSEKALPLVPIKFADQLRLVRMGPAGGVVPSEHLPKQRGEEAPGPFHPIQLSCMHPPFTGSLGTPW